MKVIDIIASILIVLAGLNWGLIGLADTNVVEALFGVGTTATKVTYILFFLAAVWQAVQWRQMHKRWGSS